MKNSKIFSAAAILATIFAFNACDDSQSVEAPEPSGNLVSHPIEVNIDGVTPASYQWYFNDAPIDGANQKVYNIVNAQPEHTGVYRLDAFDEGGAMVVSMDVSARVLEDEVPQAGDGSLPVGAAIAGIAACGALLAVLMRRRQMA